MMARVLNCKGLGGLSVVLDGVHIKVAKDVTVIKSNLRKLKLFTPISYMTEKKKYSFNVIWSRYSKFRISLPNEFSV